MINIGNACDYAFEIARIEDQLFNDNLEVIYGIDKLIKVAFIKNDDKIIGYITFKLEESNAEIYNFGILPKFQSNGYGTKLLKTLDNFNCSLEVRESNLKAISFYKKNDFFESYIRKGYYGNEDAIVLERKRTMTEKAYAKVNLILNVVDKLDNGYHKIEFLMNTLDLHDIVTVTKSDKDEVIVKDNPKLSNLDNLAFKALQALRQEFGFDTKYKIEIEKNIPVAAGMAGGSSDAAAVLRIINKLENLNLSLEKLSIIGSRIGSDVSFCVYSKLAIARGTGEKIELVSKTISPKHVLVINPGIPLSTKDVYQNHIINNVIGDIDKLLNAKSHIEFELCLENSLAVTARLLCPQMNELESELEKFTDHRILVSGSGPTLLVFSEDEEEIKRLYAIFKPLYKHTHIAKMG